MRDNKLYSILVPIICSKAIFGTIVCLVSLFTFETVPAREVHNFDLRLVDSAAVFIQNLKYILLSADGHWYLDIANNGYHKEQFGNIHARNWVYFPLFPMLVAGVSNLTGHVLFVALGLNSLLLFIGLLLFRKIANYLRFTEREVSRAIWILCFFPSAIFFNTPVSESLFFALLAATFYSIYSSAILRSGFLMLLLGLSRPTGFVLYPVFILAFYELGYFKKKFIWEFLLALLIAPIGVICFSFYLQSITGNAFAFIENQVMWGRLTSLSGGISSVLHEIYRLDIEPWNITILNLIFILVAIIGSVAFLKKGTFHLFLVVLIPLTVSAASGSIMFSGRYALPLFPIYLGISRLISNEVLEKVILIVLGISYAFFALGFSLHVTAFMA